MGAPDANGPVRTYVDPRVEVYAPTGSSPYYRVRGYDDDGERVVDTTGGRTLASAQAKAEAVVDQLRGAASPSSSLRPGRVAVSDEVQQWLDPFNHRTREGGPWSTRHAENVAREWRLRIAPHIDDDATVAHLADKQLWIRILNSAQADGLAPASVQKTGQTCRSLISWLLDRDLLDRNPMQGVTYTVTRAQAGGDPLAVTSEHIPNMDMVFDLAWAMAWPAWPQRPGRGGNRQRDAVGPRGRALQPVLVATTGLRNGELFALRPSHLKIDDLEVHIREQLVQDDAGRKQLTTPKHGSVRTVTFAGFLQDDLRRFIERRRNEAGEKDPILFCAAQGGLEDRSRHSNRFRAAAERARWPGHLTWYGLRHLYAVTMLERLPLEIVSKLMGHHSPDFTAKRYLSLRVGWLDQARQASSDLDPVGI